MTTNAYSEQRADYDILNLGCGDDHHLDAHNVDANPGCRPDEVVDLDDLPWPWADRSISCIRAYHVLEHIDDLDGALSECARILVDRGFLEVKVPIGIDARADPDHEHEWTWRTPTFYCGERHWDTDVGLEVAVRRVDLWSHHPNDHLRRLHDWWLQRLLDKQGAGPWCFDVSMASGEFSVVFQKA